MESKVLLTFLIASTCAVLCACEINFKDRDHLQSHMEGQMDLSRMSEDELRFIYFKSHDIEGNNKLDGCELIQSLMHFHAEDSLTSPHAFRIFSDDELSFMIDPLLEAVDKNLDGFIDYPEFVAGPGIIGY